MSERVEKVARELAASRGVGAKPDPAGIERQRQETYRRTLAMQGRILIESPEEEAALREYAEKNADHTTVHFSPDPPGWGE